MNLFLDTSALVKLYHEEAGTENLSEFLYRYADNLVITISDLSLTELHSAFLRRVRTGEIEQSVADEIFKGFDADAKMLNIVETDHVIKIFSVRILDVFGGKMSFRTLDAIQLSTAIISHQTVPINYFVSSDKKLLKIAEKYFSIFNPEDV